MTGHLLRGVLIGLLFGLPAGAVGAMTVQRAWSFGLGAGLLTGLGSSVADCLYAVVGAFGLTLVSDFLLRHQTAIHLLGGGLILCMGIRLMLQRADIVAAEAKPASGAGMFLSSFAIGVANPAAVLTFLFAFSYFGISGATGLGDGICLVCGVFLGTYFWWGTLSAATCAVKRKTGNRCFGGMNRLFGGILTLFGAAVFLRLFL